MIYKNNSRNNTGKNNPNYKGGKNKKCAICDKEFYACPGSKQRFCSRECTAKDQLGKKAWNSDKTGDPSKINYDPRINNWKPKAKKRTKEEIYNKEYRKKISERMMGKKNPNWKPKEKRKCLSCDNTFVVLPSSKKKFCSVSCSKKGNYNPMKNLDVAKKMGETYKNRHDPKNSPLSKLWSEKRDFMLKKVNERMIGDKNPMKNPLIVIKSHGNPKRNIKPNKLETHFIKFIKNNDLPFKYVGNGKFFIGSKIQNTVHNPDFIHNKKGIKILIEIGARYWHSKKNVKKLILDYSEMGWRCLFFTQKQIYENPNKVKEVIINAMG